MDEESVEQQIQNLHAERSGILAAFCEFLTELFGEDEEPGESE